MTELEQSIWTRIVIYDIQNISIHNPDKNIWICLEWESLVHSFTARLSSEIHPVMLLNIWNIKFCSKFLVGQGTNPYWKQRWLSLLAYMCYSASVVHFMIYCPIDNKPLFKPPDIHAAWSSINVLIKIHAYPVWISKSATTTRDGPAQLEWNYPAE